MLVQGVFFSSRLPPGPGIRNELGTESLLRTLCSQENSLEYLIVHLAQGSIPPTSRSHIRNLCIKVERERAGSQKGAIFN